MAIDPDVEVLLSVINLRLDEMEAQKKVVSILVTYDNGDTETFIAAP